MEKIPQSFKAWEALLSGMQKQNCDSVQTTKREAFARPPAKIESLYKTRQVSAHFATVIGHNAEQQNIKNAKLCRNIETFELSVLGLTLMDSVYAWDTAKISRSSVLVRCHATNSNRSSSDYAPEAETYCPHRNYRNFSFTLAPYPSPHDHLRLVIYYLYFWNEALFPCQCIARHLSMIDNRAAPNFERCRTQLSKQYVFHTAL